jgi:hypothetical protein
MFRIKYKKKEAKVNTVVRSISLGMSIEPQDPQSVA